MFLLLTCLFAWSARLAVLDIDGTASEDLKLIVGDALRAAALKNDPSMEIITKENMLLLVNDMGGEQCSQAKCEVEVGRILSSDLVVSGHLLRLETKYLLSTKLHRTSDGKLLALGRLSADTPLELLDLIEVHGGTLYTDKGATSKSSDQNSFPTVFVEKGVQRVPGTQFHASLDCDLEVAVHELSSDFILDLSGGRPMENKANFPATGISMYRAMEIANELSDLKGLDSCYHEKDQNIYWDSDCSGWRLPTADEWLYLALGKSDHPYSGSGNVDSVAWYIGNSNGSPRESGQKKSNKFGLHDMSGNLWEWVWPDGEQSLLNGPYLLLGGSFRSGSVLTEAKRVDSSDVQVDFGLRLVRTVNP